MCDSAYNSVERISKIAGDLQYEVSDVHILARINKAKSLKWNVYNNNDAMNSDNFSVCN